MQRSVHAPAVSRRWRRWRKKCGPEIYRYRFVSSPEVHPAGWPEKDLVELTPQLMQAMAQRCPRELPDRGRRSLSGRIGDPDQTCWVIVTRGGPAGLLPYGVGQHGQRTHPPPGDSGASRGPLARPDTDAKRGALRAYQVWHPRGGRFAVGQTSVTTLIHGQMHRPTGAPTVRTRTVGRVSRGWTHPG